MKKTNYCTTTMAARMLGLSVGTVQNMASKNELEAWVTQGGHRRILVSSVQEYKIKNSLSNKDQKKHDFNQVLLLSNSIEINELNIKSLDIIKFESPIDALLNISTIKPKIIIAVDEKIPDHSAQDVIYAIYNDSRFDNIILICNYPLDGVKINRDRVNFILLNKSINAAWLSGFLYAYDISSHSTIFKQIPCNSQSII